MDSFASLFCDKLEGQETFEDFLSTETEDFVPDSLAAFIDEAKATLRATQMSLRGHLDSPSRSSTICDDDDSTTPKYNNMLEDDDDRLLRDEVMGKFKGAQMFSPKSDVMISPTKMNISGISITSPSKSTPHMDDQSDSCSRSLHLHSSKEMNYYWLMKSSRLPRSTMRSLSWY